MKRRLPFVVLALAIGASGARPARADATPPSPGQKALDRALEIEGELIGALDKVRRSTVSVLHLRKVKNDGVETPPILVGCGSGVLISQRGTWVLTNYHVIEKADALQVVLCDGTHHDMKVLDTLENYDIAVLGFVKEPKGLKSVPVKAARGVEEGSWVFATGNPCFLAMDGQSVATLGVVSGLDRILPGKFSYPKAIQHDAEVNRGNSGGPLWNLKGDLIGINGKIVTDQHDGSEPHNTGASFSIPSEQIVSYLASMVAGKNPSAGDLGVACETFLDKDGNPAGARVTVVNGSIQAPPKGLQQGDVITKIVPNGGKNPVSGWAGTVIRTASDLTQVLALLPADTSVKVSYRRKNSMAYWSGKLQKQ